MSDSGKVPPYDFFTKKPSDAPIINLFSNAAHRQQSSAANSLGNPQPPTSIFGSPNIAKNTSEITSPPIQSNLFTSGNSSPSNAQPPLCIFGPSITVKDSSADDMTPPALISQSYSQMNQTNVIIKKQSSQTVKVADSVMKDKNEVDVSFKNRQAYKQNKDEPEHKMTSQVVPPVQQLKVQGRKQLKINKQIKAGSHQQNKKKKKENSQVQSKLQSLIKELQNKKQTCDKQVNSIKIQLKKLALAIRFQQDNRDEDDQNAKKEIKRLKDEIQILEIKRKKLIIQSQDAAKRIQVQQQNQTQNYEKSLIIDEELKITGVYDNLIEEGQRLQRKINQNQKQYKERVIKLVDKNQQLQRKNVSEKQMNQVLSNQDQFILKLCENQHDLNQEREKLKEKIKKAHFEDQIEIESNQDIFERALFDNYKEFLQFFNKKHSRMEEEEELTIQEKNQRKIKLLLGQVPNLKELLFEELETEKESKERQIQEEQQREQEEIRRREEQKERQERKAKQKAEREQQQRRREQERKALDEEFNIISQQIKLFFDGNKFKAEVQKQIIPNLQDFEKALQILNIKSQIIEQALQTDVLFREKIKKLKQVGGKLGRKKDIADAYEQQLNNLQEFIYKKKEQKVQQQEQALNIWKQTERKRKQIEEEEELFQRERLRFISALPKKELYANKIEELRDRIPPQKYQILKKKQKYINQIKVLNELNKVSKEQMEINKFDIKKYQFLIYEKGKLIDKISADEAEGKKPEICQEFTKIQSELQQMQAIINMSFINNSYDIPQNLLIKTKQDLFIQVSDLELKDKRQKIAQVEQKNKRIQSQLQQKQKILLELKQKLEKKQIQNEKLRKDNMYKFKQNLYISKKEELEDRIIPKELVEDSLPSIVIKNKEVVQEYFKLQQPEQLTQLNNQVKELRYTRIKLQYGYSQLLEQSKQAKASKKKKNPIYLGQIDEDHPKTKKLNEELKQYIEKCQQINTNKKNKQKGGVSQIRMGISQIIQP